MSELERQRIIREKVAHSQVSGPTALSTGFRRLDAATGGFSRGAVVELFGAAGCGKTTLALQVVARTQESGGAAAWVDAEHCFDPGYASSLGVAIDRLPVAQPNSAEEALEVVRRLAASGAVDLLVVDSAAALVPQIELATGIGAGGGGAHSRALASGLRRMAVAMRRSGAVVLFLNQTRVRPERTGDTAETAAGGPALKLFAALRIAMSRAAPGGAVALRALKNKASGAFAECELRWRDGAGFTESP